MAVLTKPVSVLRLLELLERVADRSRGLHSPKVGASFVPPLQVLRSLGNQGSPSSFLRSLCSDLRKGSEMLDRALKQQDVGVMSDAYHHLLNAFGHADDSVGVHLVRNAATASGAAEIEAAAQAVQARVQSVLSTVQSEPEFDD
jgi:hypothetical protein